MTLKKVLGIVVLNDGIAAFLLGMYRILTDVFTPGRYDFRFPWTPHEIKYVAFTAVALVAVIVGIVMIAKDKKKSE